jgi:hypothetical protein
MSISRKHLKAGKLRNPKLKSEDVLSQADFHRTYFPRADPRGNVYYTKERPTHAEMEQTLLAQCRRVSACHTYAICSTPARPTLFSLFGPRRVTFSHARPLVQEDRLRQEPERIRRRQAESHALVDTNHRIYICKQTQTRTQTFARRYTRSHVRTHKHTHTDI